MNSCSSISKLPTTLGLMTGLYGMTTDLATEGQALGIGQLNALQVLVVGHRTEEAITELNSLGTLGNLLQLSRMAFFLSLSMTKLPESVGLMTNLLFLDLFGLGNCESFRTQ